MGLFDETCRACRVSDSGVKMTNFGTYHPACLAQVQGQQQAFELALSRVLLSTGDLKHDYEIVDVVMTLQASRGWDKTWALVTRALRADALQLGCNAVINIHVEHRVFVQSEVNFFAGELHQQGIEFFACGTAVKVRAMG